MAQAENTAAAKQAEAEAVKRAKRASSKSDHSQSKRLVDCDKEIVDVQYRVEMDYIARELAEIDARYEADAAYSAKQSSDRESLYDLDAYDELVESYESSRLYSPPDQFRRDWPDGPPKRRNVIRNSDHW